MHLEHAYLNKYVMPTACFFMMYCLFVSIPEIFYEQIASRSMFDSGQCVKAMYNMFVALQHLYLFFTLWIKMSLLYLIEYILIVIQIVCVCTVHALGYSRYSSSHWIMKPV